MSNIKTKIFSILATSTLIFSIGILAGCNGGVGGNVQPIINEQSTGELPYANKADALNALETITIAEPDNSSYNRKENFGEWHYSSKDKHNTRFEALEAQGENVKIEDNKIVGGTWYIKYTGETVTCNTKDEVSKTFDIDHIIPLSYAQKHGAANWTQDKREEFANDLGKATNCTVGANNTNDFEKHSNLIVSDAHSNREKSDKGPANWMPSNRAFHLEYAERWINIATYYGISITKADYDVLKSALQ